MIKLEAFQKQLRKRSQSPPPYVVLTGEEEYLRSQALESLVDYFGDDADVQEISKEALEASDDVAALVFDELCTNTLFGTGKIVRIRQAEFFLSKADAAFNRFMAGGAPDAILVLEGNELVKKKGRNVTKSKTMQALEASDGVIVDCAPLSDRVYGYGKADWDCELTRWVVNQFEAAGKQIAPQVALAIHRRETTGLRGIASEIQKLILHVGAREHVLIDDVDALMGTGDEATLFEVVDAFGERDLRRVLAATDRLFRGGVRETNGGKTFRETEIASRLMPLLGRRLRELGRLTEIVHSGASFEDAASEVIGRGRRWLFGKMELQYRARKGPELADAVLGLGDTDFSIKTSRGGARDLVVSYLAHHCRRPAVAVADNPFAGRRRP